MGRSATGKNIYPKTRKPFDPPRSKKTEEEWRIARCEAVRRHREKLGPRGNYRQQRNKFLKRVFNISLDEYESMLIAQSGRCAICGMPDRPSRALSVDHNHSTGKIRALLCHLCNVMLGSAKESEETLMKAISYLRDYNGRI